MPNDELPKKTGPVAWSLFAVLQPGGAEKHSTTQELAKHVGTAGVELTFGHARIIMGEVVAGWAENKQ